MKKVRISLIADGEIEPPFYATPLAAGADVRASNEIPITILPTATALVPTGLYFEIPSGYEIQVRPRSGLAFKFQVTVLNAPGTIDADYRGELKILLINHGKEPFVVQKGDRIAQIVVKEVITADFVLTEALTPTGRGSGGFGSTGTN